MYIPRFKNVAGDRRPSVAKLAVSKGNYCLIEGGPNPPADMDRGGPNPGGVQLRCDTGMV